MNNSARLTTAFLLALLIRPALPANLGVAAYGLPRFDQQSVTNLADALVETCKSSAAVAAPWVSNCRVEFSWLVTFSAAPGIETTNTRAVVKSVLERLPSDAILTITVAVGFHSSEGFSCADLTSDSKKTASKLDDAEKYCRKTDPKSKKCLPHEEFEIPSYKSRVSALTASIREIYGAAAAVYVTGAVAAVDRRSMLRFNFIPHLEDQCSAAQYKYLKDWFDDRVPLAFSDLASKPSIRYRRSPNGDWPQHDSNETQTPRVTGSALELHGAAGETVVRKKLPDTTVKALLGNGDTYTPDGTCIDWNNAATVKELRAEFATGVSILYWQPQLNGRADCATPTVYPQFDTRRSLNGAFSLGRKAEYLKVVHSIRDNN